MTVGALQQNQTYAQNTQMVSHSPSTAFLSASPDISISPPFGCPGSCTNTITLTLTPTAAYPSFSQDPRAGFPTISLPTNPNGKSPLGLFNSLLLRRKNWVRKFLNFDGNPPGNLTIPGTGINPLSITPPIASITLPGGGSTSATPVISGNPSGGNGNQPPSNPILSFANLLRHLFGLLPITLSPKPGNGNHGGKNVQLSVAPSIVVSPTPYI